MLKIKLPVILLFLLFGFTSNAQEIYIIEGDTLELQQEVSGTLNLFFSEENSRYRYFIQKEDRMSELRNIRVNGVPQYQLELREFTSDAELPTVNVKFALYSLKHFVNLYNAKVKEDYQYNASTDNVKTRFGFFTGFSNNIYTDNPENILAPTIGFEFEIYDPNLAPRHSAFLHLRQSFKREVFRYTSTQLSINYRFKVIRLNKVDFHIDTELATALYSRNTLEITNDAGEITDIKEESGFSFTAPLSFGVGSDIQVTSNSYITVAYNDVVSIVLDSNGNFPLDFSIGYKYNL